MADTDSLQNLPPDGVSLLGFERLQNHYLALRHGPSEANAKSLIVSKPENGLGAWGLTEGSRELVAQAAAYGRDHGPLDSRTIIYTSDFARARQSADSAAWVLAASPPKIKTALRERDFGDFELTDSSNYQRVWDIDAADPSHHQWGVESLLSIYERSTTLIMELERMHTQRTILLVSHGDVLRILQCAFERLSASRHRSLPSLAVAELRELRLK